MQKYAKGGKVRSSRHPVKTRTKKPREKAIEKKYKKVFSPHSMPHQGFYMEEDNLEQPSALKYIPSTTTTTVTASFDYPVRLDAELARNLR